MSEVVVEGQKQVGAETYTLSNHTPFLVSFNNNTKDLLSS